MGDNPPEWAACRLAARLPISPLAELALARLISLPLPRLEVRADAHLIGLRPPRRLDAERAFQNLADGHVREWGCPLDLFITPVVIASVAVIDPPQLEHEPTIDAGVPGIGVIALVLLGPGRRDEVRLVEPPDGTRAITRD